MAAKKRRAEKTGGPYLATAVFCESIVEGNDGTMSAIRIVDHLTLSIPAEAPADVPSDEKRLPASIWAFISLKKGYSRRQHEVRFVLQSPSGNKSQVIGEGKVEFREEPHSGANFKVQVNIAIKEGGLFWMDVLLDGKTMTRMPLQITVKRMEAQELPLSSATPVLVKSRKRPK